MSSSSAQGTAQAVGGVGVGGRRSPNSEPLKLGSLTEVWKQRSEWNRFVAFLEAAEGEGEDSDGRKMSLTRYAKFLELYVRLDQAERVEARPEEEVYNNKMKLKHKSNKILLY